MRQVVFAGFAFCLSACAGLTGSGPGNPDAMAYAGSTESVYSVAGNPPKTIGVVSYDPSAVQAAPSDVVATPAGSAVTTNALPPQDYGPTARDPLHSTNH
jgi:hypothetical protein